MDSEVLFDDTDPQDSDWSVRLRYTPFDQVGPYRQMRLFFFLFFTNDRNWSPSAIGSGGDSHCP